MRWNTRQRFYAQITSNDCAKSGGTINHLHTWPSKWPPSYSVNTWVKKNRFPLWNFFLGIDIRNRERTIHSLAWKTTVSAKLIASRYSFSEILRFGSTNILSVMFWIKLIFFSVSVMKLNVKKTKMLVAGRTEEEHQIKKKKKKRKEKRKKKRKEKSYHFSE